MHATNHMGVWELEFRAKSPQVPGAKIHPLIATSCHQVDGKLTIGNVAAQNDCSECIEKESS